MALPFHQHQPGTSRSISSLLDFTFLILKLLPTPAPSLPCSNQAPRGKVAFSCLFLAFLSFPLINSFAKQCSFTAWLPSSQEIRSLV